MSKRNMLTPQRGGMEVFTDSLATALRARGHTVDWLLEGEVMSMGRAPRSARSGSARSESWSERYDVAISVSHAGRGLERSPLPIVTACHGTGMMELMSAFAASKSAVGVARVLKRLLLLPLDVRRWRRASVVVSVGEQVQESLANWPYCRSDAILIPNGVESVGAEREARSISSLPESLNYFLYVGRLAADKNVHFLLQVMQRLPDDGPALVIAGSGPEDAALRLEVKDANLGARVRFLGDIDRAEVLALMGKAKAVVFPGVRREGLSISLLEALSVGSPIVATRVAAPPSLAASGIQVLPLEAGAWSDTLVDDLDRTSLPGRFTMSACVDAYVQVLRRVSEERRHDVQ
ncbi:glycosyltransferase family 4 protein [Modestobacter lapidis]|nr:glycosyltransferase family 4 protein [Modestobacter lapidis]